MRLLSNPSRKATQAMASDSPYTPRDHSWGFREIEGIDFGVELLPEADPASMPCLGEKKPD